MKPTHFKIIFGHTADNWNGEMRLFMGDKPYPLRRCAFKSIASKHFTEPATESETREEIKKKEARQKKLRRIFPGIDGSAAYKSKEDFEKWFVERVKEVLFDQEKKGIRLEPLTHVEHFRTRAFRDKLKRCRYKAGQGDRAKKFILERIDAHLMAKWYGEKPLADLSRDELFAHFKGFIDTLKKVSPGSKPITPGLLFQRAYNMGLFSSR